MSIIKITPVVFPAVSVTTNTYVPSAPVVYPLDMLFPLSVAVSLKVSVTSPE